MSYSNRELVERAIAKTPRSAAYLKSKYPQIKNIYATIANLIQDGYDVKKDYMYSANGTRFIRVYSL